MPEARRLLAIAALLVAFVAAAQPAPRYGLGRTPTNDEIRALDISVAPDGNGLPAGRGSVRDGRALYEASCAGCHGMRGEGVGVFPPVAGGRGTLATPQALPTVGAYWPYATTVWDYIRRSMPYLSPGMLGTNDVYALTAYVLYLNSIVGEDVVLDERSLPAVRMPNRGGFVDDPRPDVRR